MFFITENSCQISFLKVQSTINQVLAPSVTGDATGSTKMPSRLPTRIYFRLLGICSDG